MFSLTWQPSINDHIIHLISEIPHIRQQRAHQLNTVCGLMDRGGFVKGDREPWHAGSHRELDRQVQPQGFGQDDHSVVPQDLCSKGIQNDTGMGKGKEMQQM